jgi:predicted AAA+ superfamily ATPase
LLHALLGLEGPEDLQSHPIAGSSWEGWALEQVLAQVPQTWKPSYYRTSAGAEIDLNLERTGNARPIAVEFKYSTAPKVTQGFWSGLTDVKASHAFVVAPVKESYPLKENVTVLPVHELVAIK